MDQDTRNISIAAYITPVGWIIAFVAQQVCNCHTPFAIFHLRQGLGLALITTLFYVIVSALHLFLLTQFFYLVACAGIIYGLLQVVAEKQKAFPLIGKALNCWFGFIK